MRLIAIAAVGLSLLTTADPALAQPAHDASAQARRLAERYVELMEVPRMLAEQQALQVDLATDFMDALAGLVSKGEREPSAPIETFAPEPDLEALQPMATLIEEVTVEALLVTYSERELEALVGFFETDIGRDILGRDTQLMGTINRMALARFEEFLTASGVDVDALRSGLAAQEPGETAPSRQMEPQSSPSAQGMTLNDLAGRGEVLEVITEETEEADR